MSDRTDEVIKVIRKYGKCVQPYLSKKMPGDYRITCPGCGKEIKVPGTDLDDVEYTVTKRGSATVFHTKCLGKAWDSKIV